ncbi:MAG: hypothetical protein H5U40_05660, partial [Polyangiaceae bacterium]|nr:hypothetical protein [Polyangiaceae bacterium]
MPIPEALDAVGTDPDRGLREEDIESRRERYGANRLTPHAERTAFARLLEQFDNLFIYVLLAAAVVTAVLGEWLDSGVILAVVLIIVGI